MGAGEIGLLHPGEMGAAIGRLLRRRGRAVVWASAGRGPATRPRAEAAGLLDTGTAAEVARRSDIVLSVCPPHAAAAVAGSVAAAGFTGVFVDANAVAPATAREIAGLVAEGGGRCVDGGIIGGPPTRQGTTRLYVSGRDAGLVRDLFAGTPLDTRVVDGGVGAASALKMAYAGWTKGTAALLLAVRALARSEGVEPALLAEWSMSQPDLPDRSIAAARSAATKGWRWIGEMEEIAATMAANDLPDGFHRAAAAVYRAARHGEDATVQGDRALAAVVAELPRAGAVGLPEEAEASEAHDLTISLERAGALERWTLPTAPGSGPSTAAVPTWTRGSTSPTRASASTPRRPTSAVRRTR